MVKAHFGRRHTDIHLNAAPVSEKNRNTSGEVRYAFQRNIRKISVPKGSKIPTLKSPSTSSISSYASSSLYEQNTITKKEARAVCTNPKLMTNGELTQYMNRNARKGNTAALKESNEVLLARNPRAKLHKVWR
ncbi:hypothetical protein [Parendozoicomonas haliclonae]|uniref:Uncharacterized protein n=1 Tax=Parendozoicomonas haliclonae TaxID=1960125 RepID=A0A1X7AKZ6_9GAMM|nr:hypothetical protein [Parendozoicomonas haliclonae]SMA47860.1 hypothetical protein EHSB41UT_02574 [Parendozoicomonas haliclonae]